MKYKIQFVLFIFLLNYSLYAQIGIGTTNPESSSVLDVTSNSKGFLPPRVTNSNAVNNPATGLLIYNLAENCIQVNTGTPASPVWTCLNGGSTGNGNVSAGGEFFKELKGTDIRFKEINNQKEIMSSGISLDGNLYRWGDNTYITAFNGNPLNYSYHSDIQSPYLQSSNDFNNKVESFLHKDYINLLLTTEGKVFAWGEQRYNLMDNGLTSANTLAKNHIPNEISLPSGATKFVDIFIFDGRSYFLITDDGKLYVRGYFGSSTYTNLTQVAIPNGVSAATFKYTKIYKSKKSTNQLMFIEGNDNEVYALGRHGTSFYPSYLRGDGTTAYIAGSNIAITSSSEITKVAFPAGHAKIKTIKNYSNTAIAIDENNNLYGWGFVHFYSSSYINVLMEFDPSAVLSGFPSTHRYLETPALVKLPNGVNSVYDASLQTTQGSENLILLGDDDNVYISGRLASSLADLSRFGSDPVNGYAKLLNTLGFKMRSVIYNNNYISFLDDQGQFLWYGLSKNNLTGAQRINLGNANAVGTLTSSHISPLLHGLFDSQNNQVQTPN